MQKHSTSYLLQRQANTAVNVTKKLHGFQGSNANTVLGSHQGKPAIVTSDTLDDNFTTRQIRECFSYDNVSLTLHIHSGRPLSEQTTVTAVGAVCTWKALQGTNASHCRTTLTWTVPQQHTPSSRSPVQDWLLLQVQKPWLLSAAASAAFWEACAPLAKLHAVQLQYVACTDAYLCHQAGGEAEMDRCRKSDICHRRSCPR